MTDEQQNGEKKKYEAPRITVISLRPEEAVLGHCKSPSAAGPVASVCTNLGACMAIGS